MYRKCQLAHGPQVACIDLVNPGIVQWKTRLIRQAQVYQTIQQPEGKE
jgi:hypothetical protein